MAKSTVSASGALTAIQKRTDASPGHDVIASPGFLFFNELLQKATTVVKSENNRAQNYHKVVKKFHKVVMVTKQNK